MLSVFIVLAVLFLLCVIVGFLGKEDSRDGWVIGAGLVVVVAAMVAFLYVISYSSSLSSNAKLMALNKEVLPAYADVAKITENITIKGARKGGDLLQGAYWKQAEVASNRWKELRDQIQWYNEKLRSKKLYKQNWFFGIWMAPVPELKQIKFPSK